MPPYLCEFCGKPYFQRPALENHLERHREDETFPLFKCKQCEKNFTRSLALKNHINSVHNGVAPVRGAPHVRSPPRVCPFCMKTFVNLALHLRKHPESTMSKHKCEQCTKVFFRRELLLDHIRRDHTGERPFVCKHCSKAFSSSIGLKAHQAVDYPRLCKARIGGSRANQKCPHCPKSYTRRRYLKIHLFTHTGSYPLRCKRCWMAFQSPFLRTRHQKECRQ